MITTIKELFPIPISIHQSEEDEYKRIYSEIEDRAINQVYFSSAGKGVGNSPEFGTTVTNTKVLPPGNAANIVKDFKLYNFEQFLYKCLGNHIQKIDSDNYPLALDFFTIVGSWVAKYKGEKSHLLAHQHTGTYLSFVYYHHVDEIQGGEIVFHAPNHCLPWFNQGFSESQFIKPTQGMLILFPSFLVHSVNSFNPEGNKTRISIAGEINLLPEFYARRI